MTNKLIYEEAKLEIIVFSSEDVITTSAFNGEDDEINGDSWTND